MTQTICISNQKGDLGKTKIPRSVKPGEAPSFGMPVIVYDPASKGSKSYLDLAKELLRR